MAAVDVVQRLYGAFAEGDVPAILGMLAPDVTWDFPGPADSYPVFGARKGSEGALGFFQALGENEAIGEFAPQRFHTDGDTVIVEGHVALTLKRNGAPVAYDWVHVFTVRDGRIGSFKGFVDTAQIVEAFRR